MFIIILMITAVIPSFAQDTAKFTRLTYEQMTNIASVNRMPHRIFYNPSEGENAEWFDAVKQGNLALVKQMVEQGQDIEVQDTGSLGQTALLWSTFIGYLDITKYLIEEQNANLYVTDRADAKHAFKSAVLGGNIETIRYLYELMKDNLDLNAQDEKDGETLLMVAVETDRVEAVEFLLDLGVDVNIVSTQLDKTAMSFACEDRSVLKARNKPLEKRLLKAGAKYHNNKTSCTE